MRAMPLNEFIAETMMGLASGSYEVYVDQAAVLRDNPRVGMNWCMPFCKIADPPSQAGEHAKTFLADDVKPSFKSCLAQFPL